MHQSATVTVQPEEKAADQPSRRFMWVYRPPPVEINYGDTLLVHATNKLDVNTAVHHHGMFFNATSWFDGAVGVTQCGIPPGQTFTYEIDTVSGNQTGTYWYHSHFAGQYADGMRAPLIIHAQPEAHAYDEEYTVNLYDWSVCLP
jgi:iron transport multicopper oxidase